MLTLLPHLEAPAGYQMALDEACLLGLAGECSLRTYAFAPAAWSLGFFQQIAEVPAVLAAHRSGYPVVRRATGGGAIHHQHELTFSLSAPATHPLFTGTIAASYERIHALVARALTLALRAAWEHPSLGPLALVPWMSAAQGSLAPGVVFDQPVTDQPVTDQPVTDQPVTDQPVTDQRVTDQRVTEQRVTDQRSAFDRRGAFDPAVPADQSLSDSPIPLRRNTLLASDQPNTGLCFHASSPLDLIAPGPGGAPAKLVGSAQRRAKGRILHHGSIKLAMAAGETDVATLVLERHVATFLPLLAKDLKEALAPALAPAANCTPEAARMPPPAAEAWAQQRAALFASPALLARQPAALEALRQFLAT
jgi:lipoate-protein ligase A